MNFIALQLLNTDSLHLRLQIRQKPWKARKEKEKEKKRATGSILLLFLTWRTQVHHWSIQNFITRRKLPTQSTWKHHKPIIIFFFFLQKEREVVHVELGEWWSKFWQNKQMLWCFTEQTHEWNFKLGNVFESTAKHVPKSSKTALWVLGKFSGHLRTRVIIYLKIPFSVGLCFFKS